MKLASSWQSLLQPSPLFLLPSSHCSPRSLSRTPSPHFLESIWTVVLPPLPPPEVTQRMPQPALPALPPPPFPAPPPPGMFPPPDVRVLVSTVALVQLAPASRTTAAPTISRAPQLLRMRVPIRMEIVLVDMGRTSSGGSADTLGRPTGRQYSKLAARPVGRNFFATTTCQGLAHAPVLFSNITLACACISKNSPAPNNEKDQERHRTWLSVSRTSRRQRLGPRPYTAQLPDDEVC